MPVDAFMYFEPATSKTGAVVEGESADAAAIEGKGVKPFEIISFEWGAYIGKKEKKEYTQGQTTPPSGSGSTSGSIVGGSVGSSGSSETVSHREVTVDNFKISKPFDRASCGLFMAATNPECVFEKAVVLFRKSGGGEPFVYLKFVFKEVRVDSVEWKIESADSSTDKPDQEDVKMSFLECDIFYSPQTSGGAKASKFDSGQKKTATYKRPTPG